MKAKSATLVLVFLLLTSVCAFGQPPRQNRPKRSFGKVIGTIAGAAGGFYVGYLVSDDDATDSTRKLTTNVIVGAIAGGLGGYFAGRAIDSSFVSNRHHFQSPLQAQEMRSALISSEAASLKMHAQVKGVD
jgi:hypothetical protein